MLLDCTKEGRGHVFAGELRLISRRIPERTHMKKTWMYFYLGVMATALVGSSLLAAQAPATSRDKAAKVGANAEMNAATSGHATERSRSTDGVNPLNGPKKDSVKADVVEYKDGEDGTIRTRAGNKQILNKTAVTSSLPPTAPTGEDAEAKKHVANIKWSDRQASATQTLDGASKDAAKSVTGRDAQSGPSSGKRSTSVEPADGQGATNSTTKSK